MSAKIIQLGWISACTKSLCNANINFPKKFKVNSDLDWCNPDGKAGCLMFTVIYAGGI